MAFSFFARVTFLMLCLNCHCTIGKNLGDIKFPSPVGSETHRFSLHSIEIDHTNAGEVKKLREHDFRPRNQQTPTTWPSSVWSKCTNPGLFAITFDDGPTLNNGTVRVLDVLAAKGAKATFFVTGYGHDSVNLTSSLEKQEILLRIHREGHQIGSHSFLHEDMTRNRTKEFIISNLALIHNVVRETTGTNITLFRPPYGEVNETVVDLIKQEFGYEVINWNLDTNDWQHKENVTASFESYQESLENASNVIDSFIALHHDPVVRSGDLAAMAIDFVRSKGYRLVTVGECIGIDDVK